MSDANASSPLIKVEEEEAPPNSIKNGGGGGREPEWWRKGGRVLSMLLDLKEAKLQFQFSLPMILTNCCYFFIPLVSVMFAGHLGDLPLAGATLAHSWATVTGFAFMVTSLPPFPLFLFHFIYAHTIFYGITIYVPNSNSMFAS